MPLAKGRFAREMLVQERKSGQRKPWSADRVMELDERKLTAPAGLALETQLQAELELARVVGRRGPAVITTVT